MLINFICVLFGVTLGFALGRYSGLREGQQNGRAYAPLELKAEALQYGTCSVCGRELPTSAGCTGISE